MKAKLEPILAVVDSWGVFAPRRFVELYGEYIESNLWADSVDVVRQGPGTEDYWESWEDIESRGVVHMDGSWFRIHQDGDIWIIPEGMEWDDDSQWFVWPNVTE